MIDGITYTLRCSSVYVTGRACVLLQRAPPITCVPRDIRQIWLLHERRLAQIARSAGANCFLSTINFLLLLVLDTGGGCGCCGGRGRGCGGGATTRHTTDIGTHDNFLFSASSFPLPHSYGSIEEASCSLSLSLRTRVLALAHSQLRFEVIAPVAVVSGQQSKRGPGLSPSTTKSSLVPTSQSRIYSCPLGRSCLPIACQFQREPAKKAKWHYCIHTITLVSLPRNASVSHHRRSSDCSNTVNI